MLHEILPPGCHVPGACVKSVQQDEEQVTVHCEDGRSFSGELLVASDGIRSAVRAQYAPQVQPRYAGYVAWRGVCDEWLLSDFTLNSVFERFGFGLPPGEQLIGYPVAGAGNASAKGKRRYNFVWYRPAAEGQALDALLTDADGKHYPLGIPPNKVDWCQVAAMREAGRRLLAPQFAEILEKTAQPFLQPIYDVMSEQLAFGRVALMGDAAFVARPHVGMGVTKAGLDACALADAVGQHGANAAAARAFEAARLAGGQEIVRHAQRLGAYMQSQTGQPGSVQRSDESVVKETAVDPSEQAEEENL
jgi:2-polyprenyl-6-methoxyphenol hydroxylase-like FAD-dependent oxidoreductase